MPRRYIDFSDRFLFWNHIRRIGGLISVVAVLFFCYCVWERVRSLRYVIFTNAASSQQEWRLGNTPVSFHEFESGIWYNLGK
jgi:heme/copper-type cytochrome/quinol oxidase subunit 1